MVVTKDIERNDRREKGKKKRKRTDGGGDEETKEEKIRKIIEKQAGILEKPEKVEKPIRIERLSAKRKKFIS